MAFTLSYSVVERNDNKLLTLTDTSGTYHVVDNPTGWGAPNPVVTAIVATGGAHTLELDIIYTASDGTSITYDEIDLFTEFAPGGGFATVADLVFPLTMAHLKVSGVAAGTSSDEFPDGIYEFTYIYDQGLGSEETTTSTELIDGQVQNAVYELLRGLPDNYESGICDEKSTLDVIFANTYLESMRKTALTGREDSVLGQLGVLERLVTNVSNYIW